MENNSKRKKLETADRKCSEESKGRIEKMKKRRQ